MKKITLIVLLLLVLGIVITLLSFWISENKMPITPEEAKKNVISQMKKANEEDTVLIIDRQGYQILYFRQSDQFLISVLKSPFEEIKQEAEKEFLRITQANKKILCQLNVVITTPRFANPDLAGQTFYLSFCKENNK
jgi:lipopolysaccharide export LptBFGC system permease protein LptF